MQLVPVRVIWAVKGKDVDLPCDITTTIPGDYPKLILWFKDSVGIPLYRYVKHTNIEFFIGEHRRIDLDRTWAFLYLMVALFLFIDRKHIIFI